MKETIRKIALFGLVGGSVFVAGQLALRLLVGGLWWNAGVANASVQVASVWINYRLNQKHTWSGAIGHNQARRFVSTRIATTLLSLGIFHVLTNTGTNYQLASAIGVIAGMVVNFIVADRWVFRPGYALHRDTDLSLGWRSVLLPTVGLIVVVVVLRAELSNQFLPILMVLLSLVAAVAALLYLTVLVYGHRDAASYNGLALREPAGLPREKVAVLMPARKEMGMYARTILNAFLTQTEHGQYRLMPVVCRDDPDTIRVAMVAARLINRLPKPDNRPSYDTVGLRAELDAELTQLDFDGVPLTDSDYQSLVDWRSEDAMVQVIVFPLADGQKPSKPLQMNFALGLLDADDYTVVTIVDAESQIQPGLFGYVDQALQDHPDVSVVQGAVQLMDPIYRGTRRQKLAQGIKRWYSWHNLLEYYRLNAGQMPFQQNNNFVPLCGNTVFLRTAMLQMAGGWPETLTEDCALGVLLTAKYDVKVLSFYMPQVATREETPPTARDLIKQRTRWNQGFLQSLLHGEWRALSTARQRLLALWILTSPFAQAASTPLLVIAATTAGFRLLVSPTVMVLAMFVPILAMFVVVALQLSQLHDYGRDYGRKIPWYVYPQVVITLFPYQAMLGYAAIRAVLRHFAGNIEWQSPARTGDHLVGAHPLGETSS